MLFIKYRKGKVQVTKGLQVIGQYDTLTEAQAAHPTAVIAAGHYSKLGAVVWKVDRNGIPSRRE